MKRAWLFLCAFGGVLALTGPTRSAELSLNPIRLELSTRQPVTTMTVRNADAAATIMQLRVMAWSQVAGEDRFDATRDVLANPPLMRLAPGAEQTVRLGYRGQPGKVEQSYRVFLQEVPPAEGGTPGQVRTLLQVSVPLFVGGEPGPPANLAWTLRPRAATADIEVHNPGVQHVQVTELNLRRGSASVLTGHKLSLYVLPGATRRVSLPLSAPLRPGEAIRVSAATDQGDLSADVSVAEVADAAGRR